MPALTMRVGTWASAVRLDSPQDEEWVHAAAIDEVLDFGVDAADIRYEHWLDAHSRCDVTVVVEPCVLVIECKVAERHANSTARRQVRRYIEAARRAYPDRPVRGMLVWPDARGRLVWDEVAA